MTSIPTNSIGPPQGPANQQLPSPSPSAGVSAPLPVVAQGGSGVAAQVSQPISQPVEAALKQTIQAQPSQDQLARITEALQKRTAVTAPELEFSVDQSSGRSIVKIVDRATKDVILQIPSEEMLRIGKALDQYQQGLLVDRKV